MGRSFGAYRFRTMHAARRKEAQQIPGGEPARLIPGGSFLRSSGLVDLPQIVNVLRGEMSIVGLRPCCDFDDPFRAASHWNDLAAVPGLTGVWRLAGENAASCDESIRWEKAYFSNLSLFGDLKVIALSFFALFRFRRII
jgi:lipopolysaccharide/colanic/teichoic acid biosynthesis glycosyltransferase